MKWNSSLSCLSAVVIATCFALSEPTYAGNWVLTGSASSTASAGSEATPGLLVLDNTSTEYSFMTSYMNNPESMTATFTGTIQWEGGGTQPSSVTLTETSIADASAPYDDFGSFSDVSDGLGDPMTTYSSTGAGENPPYPNSGASSSGTHSITIPMSLGEVYEFTRTLTASGTGSAYVSAGCEYTASVP